jgi:hypothetical protein
MATQALPDLVRRYLRTELEYRTPPCLHRYRGIVREREIARRRRAWIALRTELEQAVAVRDTPNDRQG